MVSSTTIRPAWQWVADYVGGVGRHPIGAAPSGGGRVMRRSPRRKRPVRHSGISPGMAMLVDAWEELLAKGYQGGPLPLAPPGSIPPRPRSSRRARLTLRKRNGKRRRLPRRRLRRRALRSRLRAGARADGRFQNRSRTSRISPRQVFHNSSRDRAGARHEARSGFRDRHGDDEGFGSTRPPRARARGPPL